MSTTLLVIGILVFLIVVHELGHFVVAKLFRVRVEEFGIGYPPRAFLLGKIGETEYTLNWIPFGGFVRLMGEDVLSDDEERKKGSFVRAPRHAQALILVAGVAMNAFAAWLLFAVALSIGIPLGLPAHATDPSAVLLITEVLPGSPAASAGLSAGDEIMSLGDGKKTAALSPPDVVAFVGERGGKEISVLYKRMGEERTTTVFPAHAVVSEAASRPALGIGLALVSSQPMPIYEALWVAVPVTYDKLKAVLGGLVSVCVGLFSGGPALESVIGPVGLVGVVGNAAEHGWGNVLVLAGFISLNLAVVNLIPIPALDGGRLLVLGIEAIKRRSISRLSLQVTNTVGIGLIIFLMIVVTYNDIARLLT